jgi:hypothetical protein
LSTLDRAPRTQYARGMDTLRTPADLSRELGISQRRIRVFLRAQFGTLTPTETRWLLNEDRAALARSHFAAIS